MTITVTFKPEDMYANKEAIRNEIIDTVRDKAPSNATSATVVNGWHTSKSDKREHCTVDYEDASGNRLGRYHIVK